MISTPSLSAEPKRPPTWRRLIALEPKLASLLEKAKQIDGSGDHFCANTVWYRDMKPKLLYLVGWSRADKHPVLSTSAAYNAAYDKVYAALPGCRDCWCF